MPDLFVAPAGEIERGFFPQDTVTAERDEFIERIGAYLTDATARAAGNEKAARAWVYHRAFAAVHHVMSRTPSSISVEGGGSRSYSGEQLKHFKDEAERYRKEFEAAMGSNIKDVLPQSHARFVNFIP